jgi:hypothetical protein
MNQMNYYFQIPVSLSTSEYHDTPRFRHRTLHEYHPVHHWILGYQTTTVIGLQLSVHHFWEARNSAIAASDHPGLCHTVNVQLTVRNTPSQPQDRDFLNSDYFQ